MQKLMYGFWILRRAETSKNGFLMIPKKWEEFQRRYLQELQKSKAQKTLEKICALMRRNTIPLLYSAKDTAHTNALALKDMVLKER